MVCRVRGVSSRPQMAGLTTTTVSPRSPAGKSLMSSSPVQRLVSWGGVNACFSVVMVGVVIHNQCVLNIGALLTGVILKRLTSKICDWRLCMFYVCVRIVFFGGGLTWEEFWNVHLLMMEFDCPKVTLCGWQDIKIQWLTNLPTTKVPIWVWRRHLVLQEMVSTKRA